jgi:predicted metal-binding membrane protein
VTTALTNKSTDPASGTILEAALRRDRIIVTAGLVLAIAGSWAYVVPAALDMYGSMNGPSAWMMLPSWNASYSLLIFLMWTVMMVAMMLPSAAPTILVFARIARSGPAQPVAPVARTYAFAAGYLIAWTLFSLAVTALQRALASAAVVSPMMEISNATVGAFLLIAVGAYQWTPFKLRCLAHCRSAVHWLVSHWRNGIGGALRMGTRHGLYCVGCCWTAMLLLFFGGVMNLLWIGLVAAFVLVEKLGPGGDRARRLAGGALVASGLWLLV